MTVYALHITVLVTVLVHISMQAKIIAYSKMGLEEEIIRGIFPWPGYSHLMKP